MLPIAVISAFIGAVLLAYGGRQAMSREQRLRVLAGALAGVVAGAVVMFWLRAPSERYVERSYVQALTQPLPLALFAAYAIAGLIALVPRFRRSAAFDRARPVVWGLALTLAGVIAGVSYAMRDFEITRWQSTEVRKALRAFREAHGDYPARLNELVPRHLSEVPRAETGWSRAPFKYDRHRCRSPHGEDRSYLPCYYLSYASSCGTWHYHERTHEWMLGGHGAPQAIDYP